MSPEIKEKLTEGLTRAKTTNFSRQELYYLNLIYEAQGVPNVVWGKVFNGAKSQPEKNYRGRILDKLDHKGFIHIEREDGGFKAKCFHVLPELVFQLEERDVALFHSPYNSNLNLVQRWRPYNPPIKVEQDKDVAHTEYIHNQIVLEKNGRYEFRFQHTVEGVVFTISKEC